MFASQRKLKFGRFHALVTNSNKYYGWNCLVSTVKKINYLCLKYATDEDIQYLNGWSNQRTNTINTSIIRPNWRLANY